ncbi:MAG: ABC transporter permease [Atribacterota bacterium]|nr:ABC transporter permease [Atribacterota bacterium]
MKKLGSLFRDLTKDFRFTIAFVILLALLFLAILSFFSPYHPQRMYQVTRGRPPSWEHPLGTNWLGQDVFWQLTFAVRNSLLIAVITSLISRIIAIFVGMVAGYRGGLVDRILMIIGDTTMVLPSLVVLIVVSTILREWVRHLTNLGLLLAFFSWAWDARVIRSQILSLREREFTFVAILSGMRTTKLVLKQYLPHVLPVILTTLINNMSWAIGMEITLAYLGLGIDPTVPTIGTMLQTAIYRQALFLRLWWWLLTPIITSILLFIALYWLSVVVSEYLDPRTRFQRIGLR